MHNSKKIDCPFDESYLLSTCWVMLLNKNLQIHLELEWVEPTFESFQCAMASNFKFLIFFSNLE
jgi:hypothetical protein